MKKKHLHSGEASAAQQSEDYVVGQVSGSLFQSSPSAGSLSALFSSAPPAGPLLFQPPPKLVKKSTETQQEVNPEVRGPPCQKKKIPKKKSAAEQKLENRESSLLKADEDEQGHQTAVRKKKRKLEMDGEKDAEHWVMKRQRLKVHRAEEALKKTRTVFVGNLPISCTKKMLRSLFRDKGTIESIRFRSMVREDPSMSRKVAAIKRKVHPKKQSMNAYVVFKDEDSVAKALERNGVEIEKDFHIRVDRASDSSSHDHKRSVFVGNLSFEISDLAFRRHFEECGSVEAVRLVRDQNSGLGKGFGYVLFESADSVQIALELDGSKLEGRSIRVKRSVKKEKNKNKTDGKGTAGRTGKGPGREKGAGPGGFKSQKKLTGKQQPSTQSSSFKGEMADPKKKPKKKGLKRKGKPSRSVHI
ncbi:RNA-binding protein 34 isoform X2 [Acanthochromis polyacanthus]|uniref:RNA-binding protein 34 isoform X2 n=1 Tax=Acanthochromis polyacanthus TaxID=80966 RepID=UPI000B9098D5|nr:RNA-binding protein 34 isoform X2 [Acanthochromis polyacanthus]